MVFRGYPVKTVILSKEALQKIDSKSQPSLFANPTLQGETEVSDVETETLAVGAIPPPIQVEAAESERNSRILVVDDLESIRKILSYGLREMGFANIIEAREGNEALRLFDQCQGFDLVITDLNMNRAYHDGIPPMDGDLLIPKILQRKENQAIILCASPASNEVTDVLIESGRIGFLPKPFYQEELALIVDNRLPRKK
jgi:two-component system, chemotaxis family, chemotaxis protein CheY